MPSLREETQENLENASLTALLPSSGQEAELDSAASASGFHKLLQQVAAEYHHLLSENISLRDSIGHWKGPARQENDATLNELPAKLDKLTKDETNTARMVEPEQEGLVVTEDVQRPRYRASPSHVDLIVVPSIAPEPHMELVLHAIWTSSDAGPTSACPLSRSLSKAASALNETTDESVMSLSVARGGDTLRDTVFLQRFILTPNCRIRMLWDFISLVVLTCDLIMVPLIVFDIPHEYVLERISLAITIFWTLDVVMSFFSGYHIGGVLELRPSKIRRHYLRSWFCFDFLVILMDWLVILLGSTYGELVGILRISRLIRISHVLRAIRILKMPSLFDEFADFVRTENLLTALNVLKSLIVIGFVNHFVACGWYGVGTTSDRSWVTHWMDRNHRDFSFRYASALHWSLTQFTPASMEIYPQCLAERVYAICILFLALVVFSSFVSSITNSMNHLRQANLESSRQRENLTRFIHENRLSLELGNRISAFAKHHSARNRSRVHEKDILMFKFLPQTLRMQLHWEVYVPVLSAHPLLFECAEVFEPVVLEVCNMGLHERSLTQGQELFTRGDEAKTMYFTISGSLEYFYDEDDIASAVIENPQWICEAILWFHWMHLGRLSAVKRSEFAAVDGTVFRRCASHSPLLFAVCRSYAEAFRRRVQSLAVEKALDVWGDHDVLQELAQDSFEAAGAYLAQAKQAAEGPRLWHTLSLVREESPRASTGKHAHRSNTA